MDALSAIGLASAIITFVDFSSKVINRTYKIYSSNIGVLKEHADLAKAITEVRDLTQRLGSDYSKKRQTVDHVALQSLVARCRSLSDELIQLLEKLRAKDPKSKMDSFRASLRAGREKSKLESLEVKIDMCRRQIMDRIVIMMSEQSSSTYELLADKMRITELSARQSREELQELRKTVLSLVEQSRGPESSRQDSDPSQDAPKKPNERVRLSEAAPIDLSSMLLRVDQLIGTIKVEEVILERLYFDKMRDREFIIEQTHEDTFRWLLYDLTDIPGGQLDPTVPSQRDGIKSPSSNDNIDLSEDTEGVQKKATRLKFQRWLNSGNGIFHVSGRLGSGKSTLMKFLSTTTATHQELQKWAGNKRLVFGRFFFWAAGDHIQRSMEGLYRGILWEILAECPDLLPDVFPQSEGRRPIVTMGFSNHELVDAMNKLIKNEEIFAKYRVCLFIDGLDEFEGDHWSLAHKLKEWSNWPGVKICVSSRPYNEFIHTFTNPEQHFKLHELTKNDIKRFVEDKFQKDERYTTVAATDKRYPRLIESIVNKADGIFLWVRLVTQELLRSLGNGYSIVQLEEELDQLPRELEELLHAMLNLIRKPDRMRAARAFLIMNCDLTYRSRNSLVVTLAAVDDLCDRNSDPSSIYSSALEPSLTRNAFDQMILTEIDRLNSRCKGFLGFTEDREEKGGLAYADFIHRSIPEFLAEPSVKKKLFEMVGADFDPANFMCLGFIHLLRTLHGMADESTCDHDKATQAVGLQRWDAEVRFGSYFWLMEKFVSSILWTAAYTETETVCLCLRELEITAKLIAKLSAQVVPSKPPKSSVYVTRMGLNSVHVKFVSPSDDVKAQERAFLTLCAIKGTRKFIMNKVEKFPELLSQSAPVNILLLTSASVSSFPRRSEDRRPDTALVEAILRLGVSPNWTLTRISQYGNGPSSPPLIIGYNQTTWTMFLRLTATILKTRRGDMGRWYPDAYDMFYKMLELYLQFDADPTVVFVGHRIVLPLWNSDTENSDTEKETREEFERLIGPIYFDLNQLIEVSDAANRSSLLRLLKEKQTSRMPWDLGVKLTKSLWLSEAPNDIPRLSNELLAGSKVLVTAVAPAKQLSTVDVSAVESWASTEESKEWLHETRKENDYDIYAWSILL